MFEIANILFLMFERVWYTAIYKIVRISDGGIEK